MKWHFKHFFFCALLLFPRVSTAQKEPSPEQPTDYDSVTSRAVLIMTNTGATEQMEELKSTLGAYLSDLDAIVELRPIDIIPSDLQSQVKIAREAARSEADVLSVIWIETSGDEFFIFVADSASERVLVQTMPQSNEGWETECDAIATLVHSALSPWLADHSMTEQEPPAPPSAPIDKSTELTIDQESPPTPLVLPPKEPAAPNLQLVVSAAYAPISSSNFDGPLTHGSELGIGLLFNKYLEADISINVGHNAKMNASTADIHLIRWPINIHLMGILPIKRFELGLNLGLVIDPTAVQGIVETKAPDDTSSVHLGFSSSFLVRFHPVPWLAIWMNGGAYFFNGNTHYAWDDEIVFTYGQIQPRFSAGFALKVPLIRQ